MQLMRKLFLSVIVLASALLWYGQVTASSITGTISDSTGFPLEGATIIAIHEPSGTVYTTISGKSGFFNIA